MGTQRLNLQPETLHRCKLVPLHVYYSCIDWSSCELNCGAGAVSNFCLVWGQFSSYWVAPPSFYMMEVPSLTTTWYTSFGWYLWQACPFLDKNEGGVDGGTGEDEEGTGRRRMREK